MDQLLSTSDDEIYRVLLDMIKKHPNIGIMADHERQKLSYSHILETIMVNNLEVAEKAIKAGRIPKNTKYPFGSISNYGMKAKC